MSQFDKVIARTLLLAPSLGKWDCYQNHFREFFANRCEPFVTGASASLMQVIDPMTRGKDRLS